MQITLTNTGGFAVPLIIGASGVGVSVPPGGSYTVNDENATVATFGDSPNVLEEFADALGAIAGWLRGLLTRFRNRSRDAIEQTQDVQCIIDNQGANALRVILGNNTNDVQVSPGSTFHAEAHLYVEIRELNVGAPVAFNDIQGA